MSVPNPLTSSPTPALEPPGTWPHPPVYLHQLWDTLGPSTNYTGLQPHPPVDQNQLWDIADSTMSSIRNKAYPPASQQKLWDTQGPANRGPRTRLHLPVGGHQPQDPLGSSHTYQQANTTSKTPCEPQPPNPRIRSNTPAGWLQLWATTDPAACHVRNWPHPPAGQH